VESLLNQYKNIFLTAHGLGISLPAFILEFFKLGPVTSPEIQSDCPLLKLGSRGQCVSLLQTKLNQHPISPKLDVDGIFGNQTHAAVRAFQALKGILVDGIVGNQTWGALDN
jgi:peptidoglycan hydrolase-like protein with peptidoglycan-binding domain